MSYFEYKAHSKHPAISRQAEDLLNLMLGNRTRKAPAKKYLKYLKWMKVAIAGLYLAGGYQKNSVQIPLSKNLYSGKSKRNVTYQPELRTCLLWLRQEGYIERTQEAHQNSDGRWTAASYQLTNKWLDIAKQYSPHTERKNQLIKSITRNPDLPVLEMRRDGERVRQNPHKDKKMWKDRVIAYNRRLESHDFKLGGEQLPPVLFSVTRIFNDGSYTRGGRYYSTFHGFNSQLRLMTKIDDEPVVEVDYKGLHPSLLYQKAGIQETTIDAYTIGDYPRKMVKKAFNILINNKNPARVNQSLVYYLNISRKEYVPEKHPIVIDKAYCLALEQAIRDHHKPLEQFFCTGVGLELQHHDSELCSHIFDYFLVYTDTLLISIHDSFIVKQTDLKHLAEAIRYAEEVMANRLNVPYREPELEAEVIYPLPNYSELLKDAFGTSIHTTINAEEPKDLPLIELLENEVLDVESLADEDSDIATEVAEEDS